MAAEPGAASAGQYPERVQATISLENGDIVVDCESGGRERIRVGNGGVVQWNCPSDSALKWWAIVMKGDTPFDGDDGWAGSNRGRQGVTRIRKDANGGGAGTRSYSYAIVASDGQQVYFRDPELEVGPVGGT